MKNKPVPGHEYNGGAAGRHYCRCGHTFHAKTAAACRAMHRQHALEKWVEDRPKPSMNIDINQPTRIRVNVAGAWIVLDINHRTATVEVIPTSNSIRRNGPRTVTLRGSEYRPGFAHGLLGLRVLTETGETTAKYTENDK